MAKSAAHGKAAKKALAKPKAKQEPAPKAKAKAKAKVEPAGEQLAVVLAAKTKAGEQSAMVTGLKYKAKFGKDEDKTAAASALVAYEQCDRAEKAKFLEEYQLAKKSGKGLKFYLHYQKDRVKEESHTDEVTEDWYTRSFVEIYIVQLHIETFQEDVSPPYLSKRMSVLFIYIL